MSTDYREDITLEGLNPREFIATSIKTAESLGWEVHSVTDKDILLATPIRDNKSCESIFIRFNGKNAEIASKHDGSGFGNAKQNEQNVASFIDTLNSSIGSMNQKEMTERIQEYKSISNPFSATTGKLPLHPYSFADIPGRGIRFLHFIIDTFMVMACTGFVGAAIGLGSVAADTEVELSDFSAQIIYVVISLAYYIFFEAVTGKTIAKIFTKTKVISEDGSDPTLKQILIRTVSRFIPFDNFTFLGDNGLHDKLSKTLVIKDK